MTVLLRTNQVERHEWSFELKIFDRNSSSLLGEDVLRRSASACREVSIAGLTAQQYAKEIRTFPHDKLKHFDIPSWALNQLE